MAIKSVSSLMEDMKKKFDKTGNRSGWRVLQGLNREYTDTFISGDNNLWQIKSEEVHPGESIAVGTRISRSDEELEKIMGTGSPVPFGTVTPVNDKLSVFMAGIQTYSSESSNLLCKEHLSSKQAALEEKLKVQLNKMMDDPGYRKKYTEHKDRLRRAYL